MVKCEGQGLDVGLTKNTNQISHWFNHNSSINTGMQVLFRSFNLKIHRNTQKYIETYN